MFTGIIEATAKVLEKHQNRIVLERPKTFDGLKIGSSVAVSGVCLSIIAFDETSMTFDIIDTTLQKTKLGSLVVGESVNLERAMRADGRFEGHVVLGHCEGVGSVIKADYKNAILEIKMPKDLNKFIVPHGSITIDGVALTVADIDADTVCVALIPHTLAHTTLGSLKTGDTVNIETDILGKYILKAHEQA